MADERPHGDGDGRDHALPPARQLRFSDSVRESSRLAIGTMLLAGRGLSQMVRRFGPGDPDGAGAPTPPDTDLAAAPISALSAARTIMVGAIFESQRVVLAGADALAARVGPAAAALWDAPVATGLRRPLEQMLAGWYLRGAVEEARSRDYAATTLLGVTGVSMDFVVGNLDVDKIVQGLALDELILQSTGGITGEAIDAVRAQAVGADSLIGRVSSRVFRRTERSGPESTPTVGGAGSDTGKR